MLHSQEEFQNDGLCRFYSLDWVSAIKDLGSLDLIRPNLELCSSSSCLFPAQSSLWATFAVLHVPSKQELPIGTDHGHSKPSYWNQFCWGQFNSMSIELARDLAALLEVHFDFFIYLFAYQVHCFGQTRLDWPAKPLQTLSELISFWI